MPLSARRHRIYASFGTTVSSICLSQHDSVVTMPLSASFMGLFRHDGVVDMPLSARLILTCRNIYTYLPFGCTQVIVCLLPLRPQTKASLLVYSTLLVNITRILHIRRFKFGFVSTLINTHVDSIPHYLASRDSGISMAPTAMRIQFLTDLPLGTQAAHIYDFTIRGPSTYTRYLSPWSQCILLTRKYG